MIKKLLLLIIFTSSSISFAQNQFWKKGNPASNAKTIASKKNLPKTQTYSLDVEELTKALSKAPLRGDFVGESKLIIAFPNADGEFENYRITEAPVMHPELAAKYPGIKSYAGQGVDDRTDVIRFSISPKGLQSMRLSAKKDVAFIEPYTKDLTEYTVYKRADKTSGAEDFECEVIDAAHSKLQSKGVGATFKNADDGTLRTFRLAMSATGEYTAYHGGTKAQALAAINATMTRVNGIFENDFNVTMVLIANTDAVIYTNSSTDPYSSSTSGYNGELQSTLTSVIGEANYDVGHLVANLQNNGNAGCIGCVCTNGSKGSGWTSHTVPTGDNFDVDYVAHEIGHQFGANHTYTFRNESGTGVQAEPGSGSTIMGYAGITGATDVQPHSDPYFHAQSIRQVTDNVKTKSCPTTTNTGNAVPTANAGTNYTIPKGTPFVLTGSGTDANSGDMLTYCWEQMDLGTSSSTYPSTTRTSGPAFRSYNPSTNPSRYFPNLATIKTGATSWQWEAVPNVARTLNFRLTVRDNRAGGANNNSDDTVITVNGTAGPFVLNAPNSNVTWNANTIQAVTWDVAGTTGNGVNAATVDILLSTDGGDTYPITLASGVPNDGSHDIVVPDNQGSQNRIMVKGTNHIFFDISNANFTIGAPVVCNATVPTGLAATNVVATTATLSWNTVTAATYDLQYRAVGASNWTTIAVTGATTNLTGLATSTQYETQVRSKCSGGSNSAYSSSINFTTTAVQLNYCTSSGNTSYQTGVSRVIFGTIDNVDGPAKNVGYEDFTNLSATVTLSSSENLTVYVNTDGNYRVDAFAWIDWNQNGDFTDSGEAYDLGNISNVANGALPTLSISIPASAQLGSTRMRVSARYNSNPTSCQTNFDGEVEDYTVNVQGSGPDIVKPVITLNGASTINLNVGQTYTELGATATDNVDGNITANIATTGTVNTAVAGTYTVNYNVSDAAGNAADQVSRTVIVAADIVKPVITLNGASTVNLTIGGTYTEQGATATDNVDGNITANIVTTGTVNTAVAGTYTVNYNVSDAAGNAADQVSRTVIVAADIVKPVITLNGASTVNLTIGGTYTEQGATATDNVDGNITANIVTTGTVNTAVAGTYTVNYNVSDAAGNAADQVSRTVIVAASSTTTLHEGFFESGWDGWSDGGSDCFRYSGSRSYENSYSIRLRDNSGTRSAMTSQNFNLTAYNQVEIKFYFYAYSMENGEDFWVRYYNGSSWSTVAAYASGSDFNNNTFYSATVTLNSSDVNFASNAQFRIQCDASANADHVYIDQVTIKGITGGSSSRGNNDSIVPLGELNTNDGIDLEENFLLYPNPVKGPILNIRRLDNKPIPYTIVNVVGQVVKKGQATNKVNVSNLEAGMYFLKMEDGEETITKKFIKTN